MTTIPYEVLLRIKNGQAVGQVRTLTTAPNGKEYEDDPVPLNLAGSEFNEFKAMFAAQLQTQLDQALTDNEELQSQVTSLTAERDEALATIETLQGRITMLTPVVDPRIITASQFLGRLTNQEKIAFLSAADDDKMLMLFLVDLLSAESIRLDNQKLIDGLAYLVQTKIITAQRANEIRG
jgi:hypothetical protein